MKMIDRIKKHLSKHPGKESEQDVDTSKTVALHATNNEKDLPPLSAYENRRKEIAESDEPIEGIFYLYHNTVIPDHYSECLISDKENPLRRKMYHSHFYADYMRNKFKELDYSEKSIPRGRIQFKMILIDKCYKENQEIIERLKELYRLPEKTTVLNNMQYRCSICWHDPDR